MIAFCRASLAFEGACQLPGFLRPDAVRQLVAEALAKRDAAFRTDAKHNVYFENVPEAADSADPRSQLLHSSKSAIAWDLVDAESPLRIAYEWDALTEFMGRVLGESDLYRYADPLGAASLMIFDEGDELGWHFDRSPFAVTLMLQPSADGGAYEYHYRLRTGEDENADGVVAALRGEHPGRITLPNEPGTLSLFRGQHSLHRVTPVLGDHPRINAVLAYSPKPGDKLNTLTQELFYGRSA
ncbi:HalD/BesD family halogenase [Amycolatopsis benzoatilytica]|uniref:HalD/BesD family halogenase n=1 Tax=Amycolatopsis benzoatilytica TaxID=346045 RepID=UPI000A045C94|nr:hypothetical protein [Amycolatopsis benzoatilytica]